MADPISQNSGRGGPGAAEGSSPSTVRLVIWIIAGILLAFWAYSYFGMGPVDGEVQVGQRLVDEEQEIQTLLAQQGERPEVDVFHVNGGRRVEIILTSGGADSLASMALKSPPSVATSRAKSLALALKASYQEFDAVERLEVGFAKRSTINGLGASESSRIVLDKDALQALEN